MLDRRFLLDGTNPKHKCKCVTKHVPKALSLYVHHFWPLELGGEDVTENRITLCPTTHANVQLLWSLYEDHEGRPPWDILRNFSEYARAVVEKGREYRRRSQAYSSQEAESSISHAI